MELKDVVLQTLSEIENSVDEKGFKDIRLGVNTGETEFLQSFKERIFVLFEGLKQDDLWLESAEVYTESNTSKARSYTRFLAVSISPA